MQPPDWEWEEQNPPTMDPHFIFAHSRAALEGHATNETIGSTPDPGLGNI